jgi:hypothetical protein
MIHTKSVLLGILASGIALSGAHAQGLLGERYFGIGGSYEDVSFPGGSVDGWGFGAEVNMPIGDPYTEFGFDTNLAANYLRVSDRGWKLEEYGLEALFRGFMPLAQGWKPYAGLGLGWSRLKASYDGLSESDSTFAIPAEIGVEFQMGQFSLTPFYRYTWAIESGYDNFWTIGGRAAYWFGNGWGTALTVSHTDWGDGFDSLGVNLSVLFAY